VSSIWTVLGPEIILVIPTLSATSDSSYSNNVNAVFYQIYGQIYTKVGQKDRNCVKGSKLGKNLEIEGRGQ
jgi:hypothetical protein